MAGGGGSLVMDVLPPTDEPFEADRAAKERALTAELQELAHRDDPASLERRYELHRALIWLVWAMGTARGQNHAEQAVAIARRLQDQRREAEALHEWARVYLYEHGDVTGDDGHPTREESQTGQRLHEEALQIRERLLGPDHPDVAESLMQIVSQGRLWAPMQPYLPMAERAVQIYERAFGPEHERTCAALEKLAMLLRFQSDYDHCLAIYERLLAIYTRVFGPEEHNHTQNTLGQIAWTHRAIGNNTAAAALMRDQLARQRSALGDYDPSVLSLIVQISDVLRKQGHVAEADAEIAQTLARLEAELGYDHPSTLTFLSLVGGHYQARNDLAQARPIYERLIAGYERTGSQGDQVIYAMTAFFTVLWRQGDRAGASDLFEKLLRRCVNPAPLIASLNALGLLHDIRADTAAADGGSALLALFARLLAFSEQQDGPDHPNIAAVLIAWAQRLMHEGEDAQVAVIPMVYRALEIHPQALAVPDGDLLRLIRSIDAALSEAGEYAAARELYLRARDVCAPILGAEHPRVIDLQVRLDLLPDERPVHTDGDAGHQHPDSVEDAPPSEIPGNAAFMIFQSPANQAAIEPLRATLTGGSNLAVDTARTLDVAIASSAEVLILLLTNNRAVALVDDQITRLQNRKVIGIGYGAARVFAQLGLEINDGACAHYGTMSMRLLVEPNRLAHLPGLGDPAGIPHGDATGPVDHVGLHIPKTSQLVDVVDVIARVQFDLNYALIVRQGHHILIGLASPPEAWTPAYADLFRAIAHALHAYAAQPFARAVWETLQPGVYPLTLALGRSTTEASGHEWHLRFSKPTMFSARLTIAGSDSVMLLFMGENREHWTREDGGDGETLTITIDIADADLRAIGDGYWHMRVTNFDTEHIATCELAIDYEA